jgi:hypothetical protein
VAVILVGVIVISFTKGDDSFPDTLNQHAEEDRQFYKLLAIASAILGGLLGTIRMNQAKYMKNYHKYEASDFSVDAGLLIGVASMLASGTLFFFGETPHYNWNNFGLCALGSILAMLTSLTGLNALVKGLSGPTSALFQA